MLVDLDVSTVASILDIKTVLSDSVKNSSSVIEAVGESGIVLRIPRSLSFLGYRRVRLPYRIIDMGNNKLLLASSKTASLVVVVSISDMEEGSRVSVVVGGSGGVEKIAQSLERLIIDGIKRQLLEYKPSVSLSPDDNQLASLGIQPPSLTLVYSDSIVATRNVVLETGYNVLATLGPGDYLVEVFSADRSYLVRMVIRGKTIKGLFGEINGRKYSGEDVLKYMSKSPVFRLKLRTWAIGETNIPPRIYEAEQVVGGLYAAPGGNPNLSPLVPLMYVVLEHSGHYVVIDPCGGDGAYRIALSVTGDQELIDYVLVTSNDPDSVVSLKGFVEAGRKIYAPPKAAATIMARYPEADVEPVADADLGILKTRLVGDSLMAFGSDVVFTSDLVSAVTPPGFWKLVTSDEELFIKLARGYGLNPRAVDILREHAESRVLAPRYGTILLARRGVGRILELLS